MPRADDLIERLGSARFISTLDFTKGYWQVPLSEDSKGKTVFSPAMSQWLMDVILLPNMDFAAAYLDDMVIHSLDWETHIQS